MRLLPLFLAIACNDGKSNDDTAGISDVPIDEDGDGYDVTEDCDDGDAAVNPGAVEVCDSVDNDCDDAIDEDVTETFYADADGDGFGDGSSASEACGAPSGHVVDATDCDDADAAVNPAADEVCDGLDNDCDGDIDEDVTTTYYVDGDADGFGDPDLGVQACEPPSGYTEDGTDCDDGRDDVYPDATEVCDEVDNNCDGTVDEGVTTTFYVDADGDGWGDVAAPQDACSLPSGYATEPGDCDDASGEVNPDATEVCDEVDNNCDGDVDEDTAADASTWYLDSDGDGFGDADSSAVSCEAPSGYIADDSDCDDADSAINPDAVEICDEADNDCDGVTDAVDDDGDGHVSEDCGGGDCDDGDGDVNPDADEVCNDDIDNDCDGTANTCTPSGEIDAIDAGLILLGEAASDYAGAYGVDGAGDVDGDGIDDIIVGARDETTGGSDAGAAYIVLGPASGTVDLSTADAKLIGEGKDDNAGRSVAGFGDMDGDGYDDLLVGASGDDDGGSSAGAAYVVLGPVSGDLDLSAADFKIIGESKDDTVGDLDYGDFDGDGTVDLLIAAQYDDDGGSNAGAVYIVAGPLSGDVDLEDADAKLIGESKDDEAGAALAGVGDVDGDGVDDVLVGARFNNGSASDSGTAYLVLGPVSGDINLSAADTIFLPDSADDYLGGDTSVNGGGDFDGDGYLDLVMGCGGADDAATDAGATFLVMGPMSSGSLDLSTVAGAVLLGEAKGDQAGRSVEVAGDFDLDGLDDVIIGAMYSDAGGSDSGAMYLVLGGTSGTTSLSDAQLRLNGYAAGDYMGHHNMGSMGDINNDGAPDIGVGAYNNDINGSNAGAVFVIFGGGL